MRMPPISLLLLVCSNACWIGCGTKSVPPSDIDQATKLLNQTLEHWQAGESLDAQREQSPPVYVADELWLSGAELRSFELKQPGELFGTNVRVHVNLNIADKSGRNQVRTVKYLVTTRPALTIAREDR